MYKKKKLIYFIPLVLLVLLMVYAVNDVLSSRQAGFRNVNRGSIYIILGLTITLLFIYNIFCSKYKIIWKSSLSVSLWMMIIWVSLVNIFQSSDNWDFLIHISLTFWWIMSYYFFYNYLSRNPLSLKFVLSVFLTMYLVSVGINLFARYNIAKTYDQDFVVTGYAYFLILFVPYIGLITNNKLRILLWLSAIILTATSFKRGPTIILPLMFFVYQLSLASMSKRWSRFLIISLILGILMAAAFIYADKASGGFLSYRFSEDELKSGSGRREIWKLALSNISQRSFYQFLIGSGSGSSVKLLGTGVHNEWIEFLFSFGLIGVTLYLKMCAVLFKRCISLLKSKSYYAPYLSMMVAYVLMVTLFSGMFFFHSSFYVFSFMGIIESLRKDEIILTFSNG